MQINGDTLRALREKDGQTLLQFAKRLGISLTYLSDIEHNRRGVTPTTLKRMSVALSVPMSALQPVPEMDDAELAEYLAERNLVVPVNRVAAS